MESNNIEKNIQDKLKGYENFEGDKMAMWAAVEEGLDENKKRRRFFFWFWFGGLGLAIGLLSLLFLKPESPTANTEVSNNNTTSSELVTTANETKVATTKELDTATNDDNLKSTQKSTASQSTNNASTSSSSVDQKTNLKSKNTIDFSKANAKAGLINFTDKTNTEQLMKDGLNDILSNEQNNKNNKTATNEVLLKINPINIPSLFADSIVVQLEIQPTNRICQPSTTPSLIKKKGLWSINLAGGITNHISNYKGAEIVASRDASESNLLGWQVQLELSRYFQHGISLTSGIQFNRSWTKFEFNQERMTESILENVVTTYHINTYYFANDTILEYGDALIEGVENREVQHHNRYDRIQIPLLIGKDFQKGKMSFGLQTGMGLDIWMHRSGKVLNIEESISEFNQDNPGDYSYNKFGYSLKFRAMAGFELTEKMNIYLQPSGNWSLSDWTRSGDELTQKPFTYGLNLGLRFRI